MDITVIVKPKHLRENSYMHGKDRACPLQEALNEEFYPKRYYVGGDVVMGKNESWRNGYIIPQS